MTRNFKAKTRSQTKSNIPPFCHNQYAYRYPGSAKSTLDLLLIFDDSKWLMAGSPSSSARLLR
jgi:hypothetical protein